MNKDLENHIHETTREAVKCLIQSASMHTASELSRDKIIDCISEISASIAVEAHTKAQLMIGMQGAKQLSVDDMVVAKDVNRYGVVKEITATSVTVAFDGAVPDREYQISEMHLIKPLGMRNPDGA